VTEQIPGRENEHVYRSSVRKVGIDPHFAFANMLADVAWARAYGTNQMLFASNVIPSVETRRPKNPEQQQLEDALRQIIPERATNLNCGNCSAFDHETKRCQTHGFKTEASLPYCDWHDPEPDDGGNDW
jgi:hypothetical protein